MTRLYRLALALLLPLLGACTTINEYYDKWFGSSPTVKPAELVALKPTASAKIVWQGNVGGSDQYIFAPAVAASSVYATGAAGQVTRFELRTGKQLARIDTKSRISGGIGVSANGNLILAGTARGEVLAFDGAGKPLWKAQLSSVVLSAPQVDQDVVVARSADGRIYGLDPENGSHKWVYQRLLPALTVRAHVGVVVYRGAVFAGFPGGRLVALALANGSLGWEAAVALPKGATELERVADISSSPVLDNRQVCAAAFQGRVACFDVLKGSGLWARDMSSVSGLTMDGRNVYVSEDKSAVVAFDKTNGASLWKQDKLFGRNISGPVAFGRYVAVGDFQGYVHFMLIEDGSFVARVPTDGSGIAAQPLAIEGGILVQTRNGGVYAITIQ